MTLRKNILANYLGTGVAALSPLFALPWYLTSLGPKQFGVISFVVLIQALLGLVDAGMSQALVREFSVRLNKAVFGRSEAATLLLGFERVYWVFALLAGLATYFSADAIASLWLNLDGMDVTTGQHAIYGAAIVFSFQFPGSIYRSLLVAAQEHVRFNAILSSGALLRHGGGVVVVLIWPTLNAYLAWQALIAFSETLIRGTLAWKTLNTSPSKVQWSSIALRPVWKTVAGMSAAVWLGSLTVQIDKVLLSRLTSLEQLGYYAVASTLALGALQLISPLVQAVLPRAIQLRSNPDELRNLSIKLARSIGAVVGISVLVFVATGHCLLEFWLRNPAAAEVIYPTLSVLLAGTALNALYNVGYVNWIANGQIQKVLLVNAFSLLLALVFIPSMVAIHGAIGAAFGWSIMNLLGLLMSLDWLKKTRK